MARPSVEFIDERASQVVAGRKGWRKVRAPQDKMVDNVDRSRDQGKCHRKQTASVRASAQLQVRVKRWGKSPPAGKATCLARQTPFGARPSRGKRLSVALTSG